MQSRNARIGVLLFLIYATFYAVFVLTNAFASSVMDVVLVAGLNLAILSGFGLLALALLLAIVYGLLASDEPSGGASGLNSNAPSGKEAKS